jgi:hypothetical protein
VLETGKNLIGNCLGSSSQDSAQSGSTGLSGGAPDNVRCARLARANWPLSGIHRRRTAINHRTVRCAPDCPVSQRSVARSARDTWPSQRLEGGTGLSGVHRTCSVCQRLSGWQRSTAPLLEGNRATDSVRCAPDCPVSHRSVARSARDTWPSQRLEGGTGLSGVHRTCSVRQRLSGCQRSAAPFKERNRAPDSVRCAPDCPVCTGLSGAPDDRRQELPSQIALNGS